MDLGLADKAVLVAGASRGIGLTVARGFLQEGAHVAITARGKGGLESASAELATAFPTRSVVAIQADMRDPAQVDHAVTRTVDELGGLNCAVSCVGSGSGPAGWRLEPQQWHDLIDHNLTSAMLICQRAAAAMQAGGALAVIGSIAGLSDVGAPLAYGAAKAALIRYTRDLARRLAPEGIRVNLVAPGNILFPGGSWDRKLAEQREAVQSYIRAEVPMGRFGRPEEIAAAVLFVSSERASFVTGACLVADGGQLR